MSINNFIPEVWSDELQVALETSLVYGQDFIISRDYEGQLRQVGDTVRINGIGDVTISDYTKNSTLSAAQELNDAQTILSVTQSKAFNFKIDDIDAAQVNVNPMNEAMRRAAYRLSFVADRFIVGHYTDFAAGNIIGSDGTPKTDVDKTTAYEYLVDLSVLLDESDVPALGRWCVVPAWFHGLLLKDLRFSSYGTNLNRETLANAAVGEAAGFMILKSNNVPNISRAKYKIIAGHKMGWQFAETVRKVEAYRPQDSFSDALKGLHLYGAKVTRPECFAMLVANRPS